ncbi:MAG: DUF4384 domain-containing protein [candidate division KSB1 bacterium]|nr:DUF4384 domain-containing protein [candidate division KSB1 bacterium]MDZ7366294.1 DUF4384 domain-containing protein [candidate division KSB1 bacterium]MDZ7404512.1 DUF4384 domain-containing protein [candidate division KSB1 bacterium]
MNLHHSFLHLAAIKIHRGSALLFLLLAVCFSAPALAHDSRAFDDIEIKVWSSQSFDDPFCSDDPVEIYFRVNRAAYITVYQINPYGGVDIIYPRAYHRWRPVYPGRTYRLIDLADDIYLYYDGVEGRAYIGIIATRQPINIVPWLEAEFRHCGLAFGRPERAVVGIDFQLAINRVLANVRLRLGTACVPTYYVAPIYVRPRVVVKRPPPIIVWPEPPRHKSYYPKWTPPGRGDLDDDDQREPQEKRPFRRRSNDAPEKYYRTPDASDSERPLPDKRSDGRSDEVKVRNDSSDSRGGKPSKSWERRVKKSRH